MAKTEHPAATLNRIRKRNGPLTTRLADAGIGGGWEITARAVPLDTPTEIAPGFVETIHSGALVPRETGVKLFSEHRDVIGVVTDTREENGALVIDARISDTQLGRDVRQLIADGALTQMSIGFLPADDGQTVTRTETGIAVAVTRAILYEVSVVPFPAYEDTAITDQRSNAETINERENTMADAAIDKLDDAIGGISADVRALRDRIDRVETAQVTEPHPLAQYRSYGDYIKNAPNGLDFRDVTVTKVGQSAQPPAWLGRLQAKMEAKKRVTNALAYTHDVPMQGQTVQYSVYKEDSLTVAEYTEGTQAATGSLTDELKTAKVTSFAGGTSLTRATINRADPAFLDDIGQRLAIKHAKTFEAWNVQFVREQIVAAAAKHSVGGATKASEITATSLRNVIIDAQKAYDDSDQYSIDGLFLTWDLIKVIAALGEEKRLLRWVGSDTAVANEGKIDPTKPISLNLYGVPVVPIPGETLACFYDKRAIVVRDDGEAPLRLQQDQVLDLRRDTAVYSECVHYCPFPGALLPWTFKQG
nr:MAG TPA: head maturation protease [Caudoviricetes sp.]